MTVLRFMQLYEKLEEKMNELFQITLYPKSLTSMRKKIKRTSNKVLGRKCICNE